MEKMIMEKLSFKGDWKEDYNFDESIKSLRTNIQFSGSNVKVIMFTSALPDEGKSSVSFELAKSLASIGKKTVFIDADIRNSVTVSRYNIAGNTMGLSQYLSGNTDVYSIIYETDRENLYTVLSGPYAPNPSELLEDELFSDLVMKLRREYDYVIIDTPPMGSLADGAVVAKHCDGAVMVIESGAISYHLEQKVKEQIDKTGCHILGVVLNKVDYGSGSYYGKYGKYGKYDKYGKYGYGKKEEE